MFVNIADERAANRALRSLDVDAESGTAHKRDLLLGKPRLKPIEIVTDGAVRHVQNTCQCKEFERLICHEETRHENRTPLIGGQFPAYIYLGDLRP